MLLMLLMLVGMLLLLLCVLQLRPLQVTVNIDSNDAFSISFKEVSSCRSCIKLACGSLVAAHESSW
jgi:hypothetical protein